MEQSSSSCVINTASVNN